MKQLMLIHGAIGGVDQLIPLRDLLKKDFEIHLLEFDGHGQKAEINSPFSLENFDRNLAEALDNIGQPTHIFGYSMGGFIALLHAAKDPSNIASIATLGTKMKWSPEIAEQEVKHLVPERIKEKVPAFAEALFKKHGVFWEDVLKRTARFMSELGELQPIQESLMQQIKIPVQLCLGDQDSMVTEDETMEVHQWISPSRFHRIPDSKHPIEQVNLGELVKALKGFVQSIES